MTKPFSQVNVFHLFLKLRRTKNIFTTGPNNGLCSIIGADKDSLCT